MNDYIERKKAIELIQPHVKPQTVYGEGYLEAIEHATDILKLIPAADVQPVKHGYWITDDSKTYLPHKCSECGNTVILKYPYCENCGAKMDGGAEKNA